MSWTRVCRSIPCAICGKPDWCAQTADGQLALCMRSDGAGSLRPGKSGGFIFRLRDSDLERPAAARLFLRPVVNWNIPVADRVASTRDCDLQPHADQLGVSLASLRKLSAFVSPRHPGALAIPMFDRWGRACGIRFRYPDGRKLSARGGREGMLMADAFPTHGTLFVTEGPTDTAAALTLGLEVVGRASCSGSVTLATEVVRDRGPERVVVVADRDLPGERGAAALASKLRLVLADTRIITPPQPHKDLRAWLVAGATRDDVLAAAGAATPLELVRA